MSVLIKDMEKPKSCYAIIDGEYEYCPFVNTDDDCVLLLKKGICERTWKGQYSKCPLIEASELCEDAVSRKATVEEIRRHGVGSFDFEDYTPEQAERFVIKLLQDLPSVTPKPISRSHENGAECEDAVSRTDVLECFADLYDTLEDCSKGIINELHRKFEDLRTLPSVTPKRKTGRWIHEIVNNYTEKTYCSECGESAPFVLVSDDYYGVHAHGEDSLTNFCPNCGSYNGEMKIGKD